MGKKFCESVDVCWKPTDIIKSKILLISIGKGGCNINFREGAKNTPRGCVCEIFGGETSLSKKYIYFWIFFIFFWEGGGDGRPKNGGMEMDDPKKLMYFARKYPCVPYLCFFFSFFFGGGDFFLIPNRRHLDPGTAFFYKTLYIYICIWMAYMLCGILPFVWYAFCCMI